MWNPKTDACDYCQECEYFLHEYWNCQGELEPCWEFIPKKGSKYKKVEVIVNDELEEILKPFMKKDVIVKSNDEIYLTTTRKDENENEKCT